MSKEKWLNKKLCSLHGDKVRIELGPQIIELKCTVENLSDKVTSPHYQEGRIDAYGKVIKIGSKMHCVDWRSKHVPKLWKIYVMKETGELDKITGEKALGDDKKPLQRFIQVKEFEDRDKALNHARGLI